MKQLDSSPSSRVSPVETECTERVNTPETVDKNLPSETASKTLHEERMDRVENSLVDIKPPRDKLQEENNESALDGEKTLQMLPACSVDEENQTIQSFESDITIKQEVQTDFHNSEFNQTGKKMDESSSVCGETNIFAVSDSVSAVDEEDKLIQVSDGRTSFNEEETSSLKDSDVPSTDLSKTDSTDNFGDMNTVSDNEEDSLSEGTATYNNAEQENRPSSSEGESSSLKDGDIPLTDLSKTDLTDISEDMNPVFNNQDDSLFDGATTYDNTEQETAFTSVDYEPSVKCCVRDSTSENNVKSSPSVCQNESSTQNNSNGNKFPSNTIEESTSSPVHFRKKIRKMEILRSPTKTSQKRKKRTLEVVMKDDPISDVDTTIYVEEDNSSPVVANGLHLNENSRECSGESLSTRHQRNSMNSAKKSNCFSSASNTVNTVQKFFVTVDGSSSDSELSTTSDDDNQYRQKCKKCKIHSLNLLAFLASVFALITGTCLRSVISSKDYRTILYLRFPGQLFTNVLQMLATPLIISGLISNLASLDRGLTRRICLRTLFYYSVTSFIALMTGVILALTIQPGQFGINMTVEKQAVPKVNILDVMLDLLRNIFPDNLMVACFKRFKTEQVEVTNINNHTRAPFGTTGVSTELPESWSQSYSTLVTNSTMDVPNVTDTGLQDIPVAEKIYQTTTSIMDGLQDHPSRFEPFLTLTDGTNLLGLVVYSLMMSIAIKRVGEQGRLLVDIFTAFYQSTLKLISFITWFSPIGIFFLLTSTMIGLEEPSTAFHQVALYIGTALVAHLGYALVLLPLVYFLMTRKNPVKFLYKNSLCICTAFATSCSITNLPVMLQCVECKARLHHQVTRLTLPLGAIINTNAGALYKSVACIFIAQYEGVPLTIGRLIIISITSALVSIGTRNLPQNGNLGILAVLTVAGIPNENVSLIMAADWILNRLGVTVNTISDVVGAGVIHHLTSVTDLA